MAPSNSSPTIVTAVIANEEWQRLCRELETAFHTGHHGDGALAVLRAVAAQLARHFPAQHGERRTA
jgi:uncharacterized membrane protein